MTALTWLWNQFFFPHPRIAAHFCLHVAMDQYLLIPFLVGWTSIYQLFWCSPGVQGSWPTATCVCQDVWIPSGFSCSDPCCGDFVGLSPQLLSGQVTNSQHLRRFHGQSQRESGQSYGALLWKKSDLAEGWVCLKCCAPLNPMVI